MQLEVKVGTKARIKQNQNIYCVIFVIFRSNKVHPMLETYLMKAIAVGESSYAWIKS